MNAQALRVEERAAPYLVAPLLTDHLDTFANASEGFKRLRELVLNLAVRGRLVKQSADWRDMTLADLGRWAIGSGFPNAAQGQNGLPILFAKVSDMNLPGNEVEIRSTNNTIDEGTARSIRANIHPAGTVVFPKIGGAIATNKRRILMRPTAIDNNCLGITPSHECSTAYLYLLLTSLDFTQYQVGTSVPALSQGVLGGIPVLLPPLAEQSRIVAKVEELMALIDRLEARVSHGETARGKLLDALLTALADSPDAAATGDAWAQLAPHFDLLLQTPADVDRLQQTLLTLAVKGRLVPQDLNDEPAAELLKRIRAEKERLVAQGKIKRERLLLAIDAEEVPYQLPVGWSWSRFGQVIDVETNLVAPADYTDWPQIAPDLIEKGTGKLLGYRTVAEAEIKSPNHLFRAGQIIYSKIRPSLSKAVIATFDGLCSADMYPLSVHINTRYALQYILSLGFLEQVAVAENRVKMPKLNQEALTNFLFPLPPLAEQSRIVAAVASLTALCDRLRERLAARRDLSAKLANALTEGALS